MRPSLKRHVLVLVREKLGLNQKDFADYVNCSESTLQAVERGPNRLKLSEGLAIRISLETGVDVQWLLANDFSLPIKPSAAASFLYSRVHNAFPKEYSLNLFDMVQASKKEPLNTTGIYTEQLFALNDYGRLRASIEKARQDRLYEVARFKLDKFIDQFEAEFGSDPAVFKRNMHEPESTIEFVEAELRSAKELFALMEYDPKFSDLSPGLQTTVDKRLQELAKISPYSQPKSKVYRSRKRDMDEYLAELESDQTDLEQP